MENTVLVSVLMLKKIKAWVEEMCEEVDGEWGDGRDFDKLIKDKASIIPNFYYELVELTEEITEEE